LTVEFYFKDNLKYKPILKLNELKVFNQFIKDCFSNLDEKNPAKRKSQSADSNETLSLHSSKRSKS
jgi:hypothetical protein